MKPTAQVIKAIRHEVNVLFQSKDCDKPITKKETARLFEAIANNLAKQLLKENQRQSMAEEMLTRLSAEFSDPNT